MWGLHGRREATGQTPAKAADACCAPVEVSVQHGAGCVCAEVTYGGCSGGLEARPWDACLV